MKKIALTLLAVGGLASQPALAQDAENLFQSKACAACHSVDMKMVGPALKDVAAEYAGQDDAVATLVESITKGSQGKWGQIPMPPNHVSEEEAQQLAEWILSHNGS